MATVVTTEHHHRTTAVTANTLDRRREYDERKCMTGRCGMPTGWDTLDEVTEGLEPGAYVGIAAPPGTAATHVLIRMAQAAYRDGYHVLFANKALSRPIMDRYFDAHWFSLPYERFLDGMLTPIEKQDYLRGLVELNATSPAKWTWRHNAQFVSGLAAEVEQHQPDILFVDGAQLLHCESRWKSRHERLEKISRDVKRLAIDFQIAVVISIPLAATDACSATRQPATLARIAGADAFAQDVDYLFALDQTPEMHQAQEMHLIPLKCRGAEQTAILLGWNFETMQFPDRGTAMGAHGADGPSGDRPGGTAAPIDFD